MLAQNHIKDDAEHEKKIIEEGKDGEQRQESSMHNCCRCRGEAPSSAAASGDEMNGGGSDGEVGSGEEGVRDGRWRVGSGGGGRGAAPGGEGMKEQRRSG